MLSDHFDGCHYFNPYVKKEKSFFDYLSWAVTHRKRPWKRRKIVPQKVPQERLEGKEASLTFVNHSTVLIQVAGYNILTDPIWSKRASPWSWIGPKRVIPPGINFVDLPPIDIVLISHNHYDHLDIPTLKSLEKAHHPRFFVSQGNRPFLISEGLQDVTELDWWDRVELNSDLALTFVPAQHFSARGLWDRNRTLWGGFAIEGAGQLIYFAGDTGYSPYFKEIRERLGAPTMALLPIGSFKPLGLMNPMHMSPQDAVQAHLDLEAQNSLAIHFGTFQMSADHYDEPVVELKKALHQKRLSLDHFWVLQPGESRKWSKFHGPIPEDEWL